MDPKWTNQNPALHVNVSILDLVPGLVLALVLGTLLDSVLGSILDSVLGPKSSPLLNRRPYPPFVDQGHACRRPCCGDYTAGWLVCRGMGWG